MMIAPRRIVHVSAVCGFFAACVDAPSGPPDLAKARPHEPTVAAQPTPNPPPPPPPNPIAEVEISGRIALPPGVKGDVIVYATDGQCWKPETRAWGQVKVINPEEGYFFVEVFVPQGSPIWMCAALVDGKKPITVHGELTPGPLVGRGLGEVIFDKLRLALAAGARVELPARRSPTQPATQAAGAAGPLPPKTGPAAPPQTR